MWKKKPKRKSFSSGERYNLEQKVIMQLEEINSLKIGILVLFNSSNPNPARRSLNGRICRVYEFDKDYEKGWRESKSSSYLHDIDVCLEFTDDIRKTFASIDEFDIIPEK